jgi:polyphosphate glucokinase
LDPVGFNEVVTQLSTLLEADYVVLGGGNARKLKRLPKNARLGSNDFAFLGGFRVWHHAATPPAGAKQRRRSIAIP